MFALLLTLAAVGPATEPGDAPFVVSTTEGKEIVGRLLRLGPDFTATVARKGREVTLPGVLTLRRAGRPVPPFPTGPQLITVNGDRLAGELLGGGPRLRFRPTAASLPEGTAWLLPVTAVLAVWLTDLPADTPPDPSRYGWVEGTRNRDLLRLRNGDVVRGTVLGFGPPAAQPAIQFRPEVGEPFVVGRKELAAVVLNPALARGRKPKGPYARVVLSDGSRLDLDTPALADDTLTGETLFGQRVELRLDAVLALQVLQGKATYLSDLKPSKVEQAGFLQVTWPWAADRTTDGAGLLLDMGGSATFYDKGLGTRPRSVLTYELAGKYQRFEATVGRPAGGGRGTPLIRVLVDGKPRLGGSGADQSSAVRLPATLRIDVSGAKELVLEVDFAPGGGGSEVLWGDARLIE
jgi:hypothetical protein